MSWPLTILRWTYCATIGWASLQTLLQARSTHGEHALILAGVELVAIAAFLFRKVEVAACIVLLAVFAVAGTAHTLDGEPPLRFFYFAATAVFIVYTSRWKMTDESSAAD